MTKVEPLDRDRVMMMGRLASIAYCRDASLLKNWTCGRCAQERSFEPSEVVIDTEWDLVSFVGFHGELNAIVASFRGTDSGSLLNWVENMRAWRTDKMYPITGNPHALVHAGFEVLWSALKPRVMSAVEEVMRRHPSAATKFYGVGHSMGGALAQLCALDVKFAYNTSYVGVTTFGSPRVGNAVYADVFSRYINESWRFTHNRDVVPSVPLMLMGFHHVSREVWEVDVDIQGHAREWLMCDGSGEDPSCHNSAYCTSIADHMTYLGLPMFAG
jgi:hypothetical protein